jgi:flagellar motor switch/type III secretory pathway protein FliN
METEIFDEYQSHCSQLFDKNLNGSSSDIVETCEKSTVQKDILTLTSKILSDISVSINVDIGQMELSVRDLMDLYQGQVFEFRFNPEQEVVLKIGEEVIALARFIMKEEILGLSITEVKLELTEKRIQEETVDCPETIENL